MGPQLQVIFLDEAISALDAETENLILNLIYRTKEERFINNRTVIEIAHRNSSIRHADKIMFIDNDKILGEGYFDELLVNQASFTHQTQFIGLK